jgi:CRP-like cAMP-binding protein
VSQIEQSAIRNRLLASLPPTDFKRLAASLMPVTLSLKQFLVEADEPIGAAYFIETGIISYLNYLEGGEALEIGLIGSEGMLGLPLILGVDRAPVGAMVQMKGVALRISPAALRQAFNQSEALRTKLLRYMQAFHIQVSQTAVCNSHHTLEERLIRWLLMAHDRAGNDRFPMTHEFMSLMLGVRRAGVTVTAGALKHADLIQYANGCVTVLDRPGLEAAACECYGNVQRHFEQLLG